MGPITLTSKIIGMVLTALSCALLLYQLLGIAHLAVAGATLPPPPSEPSPEASKLLEPLSELFAWFVIHLTIHQVLIPLSCLLVGLYLLRERNLLIRLAAPARPALAEYTPAPAAAGAPPPQPEPEPDYSKYAPKPKS